jgi:hypothetical protein
VGAAYQTEMHMAREGNLMHHCVGGYVHAMKQGTSEFYSLRDQKNEPHITVEVPSERRPARGADEGEAERQGVPNISRTSAISSPSRAGQ